MAQYAPTRISGAEEKEAFYKQLHTVQERLLKGDTAI